MRYVRFTAIGMPVLAGTVLALLLGTGCSPEYPKCENDEHCAAKGEYCVNGLCQQCRDSSHCAAGSQCSAGKCQPIPGYCTADSDCPMGQKCRDNRCGAQCLADGECGANERCQAGRCVPAVECQSDADCPGGRTCEAGHCVAAEVRCRPATVYFDFDSALLRDDARRSLEATAACLKNMGNPSVTISGHCDERGTEEYNLALGERRATAVKEYLSRLGAKGLKTVSYGENRPVDPGHDESAWERNRRAEFEIGR